MSSGYTIFIPVYNEVELLEANLIRLRSFLQGLDKPFQILIGSNGSVDQTNCLGRELADRYDEVDFFHLPFKGPGRALKRALDLARYQSIVCQDMDLSVDLDFIPRALTLLKDHHVVVGSKFLGNQYRSWYRIIGSGVFIAAVRILLRLNYRDYSLAAKGYRKDVLVDFKRWIGQGTSYVLNVVYWANRAGLRVVEIPVLCEDHRNSRFNLVHEGLTRFRDLGRLWLSARKEQQE